LASDHHYFADVLRISRLWAPQKSIREAKAEVQWKAGSDVSVYQDLDVQEEAEGIRLLGGISPVRILQQQVLDSRQSLLILRTLLGVVAVKEQRKVLQVVYSRAVV
jgi:hypothetical protein